MKFLKTEKDKDGTLSISVLMYIGNATYRASIWATLAWMLITGFSLLAYLGCFSVLKFRRVSKDAKKFETMKKSIQELTDEEKRRLHNGITNEKAFLDGNPEAGTLEHDLDFLALQRSIRNPRHSNIDKEEDQFYFAIRTS